MILPRQRQQGSIWSRRITWFIEITHPSYIILSSLWLLSNKYIRNISQGAFSYFLPFAIPAKHLASVVLAHLSWVRSVLGPPTKTSLAFEGSIRDRRTSFMRSAYEPYEIVKCLSYIGRLPRWSLKKSALQFSCKCFSLSENVTPIFQEAHEIFLVLQYWSSVAGIPDFNGMGADLVEGFVSPVWFQNVKQP